MTESGDSGALDVSARLPNRCFISFLSRSRSRQLTQGSSVPRRPCRSSVVPACADDTVVDPDFPVPAKA